MDLVKTSRALSRAVASMRFAAPVTHVYNPLEYAWETHVDYLERWGQGSRELVLLGMNPGPWGMAQTGVPFGEVEHVRDWLGIRGRIRKPDPEHPKRPVQGFDCARSEVSGRRLWGWARHRFKTPERFFARFFVANYCPTSFMEDSGRNRTPDKLPASERDDLFRVCDLALRRVVEALRPRLVIGVGAFAAKRARLALAGGDDHEPLDVSVAQILHPSPASPKANAGWAPVVEQQLCELGVIL